MSRRPPPVARAGLALAAAAALWACEPGPEHALLLQVESQVDVASLELGVLRLDDLRSLQVAPVLVDRTAAATAQDPIRVGIRLDGPGEVMVTLRADDGALGWAVASRCYAVEGVVRDSVLLVGPLSAALDRDGDGWASDPSAVCLDPGGGPCAAHACGARAADCDDLDPLVHPGAPEVCGTDGNCDGAPGACVDGDGDGVSECPAGELSGCDCDDGNAGVSPLAAEICGDRVDQDCDGRDALCDRDGDGVEADVPRDGAPDCDDTDARVYPGAPELCTPDGEEPVDENCNGRFDEAPECTPPDLDRDGSPDCSTGAMPCDCDDCDPGRRPGAAEACGNGIDEDCDGSDLPCSPDDGDRDGVSRLAGDCDDRNPAIRPGAIERCGDAVDDDCDGTPQDCAADADGDGFLEPAACEIGSHVAPDRPEVCNGIDDDCDGVVDEAPAPGRGCVTDDAGAREVDFARDLSHCRGCRLECAPVVADLCSAGGCQCSTAERSGSDRVPGPPCAAGDACCADGCVDVLVDDENCGACGRSCAALGGLADGCARGVCGCDGEGPCADGLVCCRSGGCRDLSRDERNCGACGVSCGSGETCREGRCTCGADEEGDVGDGPVCPSDEVCCGGSRACRRSNRC